MDRISGLPDDVLFQILSYLSTKEAALTCLLSKRWHDLFALSPYLRLEDKELVGADSLWSFSYFVDRVLAVSGNSPIKKFSLKYRHHHVNLNLWVSNVLSRGGALDLLHLDVALNRFNSLSSSVFTCKTLVELKLGRELVIVMVPENPSFPALKTLFLDNVIFDNNGEFEALVSACPVLEELTICGNRWRHWKWCSTVSSPTLERLTMNRDTSTTFDFESLWNSLGFRNISFDTPSLIYLEYDTLVPDDFHIINLDSLVEAKLNLNLRMFSLPDTSNPTNLIKGLSNVKILTLSTSYTCEVFKSFGEAIPVMKNLSRLSIETRHEYWRFMPLLLNKSPNLQTLAIKGSNSQCIRDCSDTELSSECSFLKLCPVKLLEITYFWGSVIEFSHLERLLEKLPCLELVKVSAWAKDEETKLKLATDMLMLPRACKIQLQFTPSSYQVM